MRSTFDAEDSSLHVRVSNKGALNLYQDALGYTIERIIPRYYQDREDAYLMKAAVGTQHHFDDEVPPVGSTTSFSPNLRIIPNPDSQLPGTGNSLNMKEPLAVMTGGAINSVIDN